MGRTDPCQRTSAPDSYDGAGKPALGAPDSCELLNSGIDVCQRPSKYIVRRRPAAIANRGAPSYGIHRPDRGGRFSRVPTATYRLLFVLVLLATIADASARRVTAHPTAAWTAHNCASLPMG